MKSARAKYVLHKEDVKKKKDITVEENQVIHIAADIDKIHLLCHKIKSSSERMKCLLSSKAMVCGKKVIKKKKLQDLEDGIAVFKAKGKKLSHS